MPQSPAFPSATFPAFYERMRGEVPVDSLKASWLIYGEGFEQSAVRRFVKRVSDVVAAMTLLILALPVILLAMLAIAVDDGMPILFTQQRAGQGGRMFNSSQTADDA